MLRNVGSNWVLTLVTIGATYVLTPFVIHVLGPEGYGTWTLITSMTGYIGLLALMLQGIDHLVPKYEIPRYEYGLVTPSEAMHLVNDEGWRISECNADVPGGFAESSELPRLMCEHNTALTTAGDPGVAWARAVSSRVQELATRGTTRRRAKGGTRAK